MNLLKLKKYIEKSIINFRTDLVLIHVGKCGGSTVNSELKENGFTFIEKHVCKVKFDSKKKYIIVIRNPISRFISAFNWRYKLVVKDGSQRNRFKGEYEILKKFNNVNTLAENLFDEKGIRFDFNENYIHHLKEDINYYIGDFLKACNSENIRFVISTETLNQDMDECFGIKVNKHEKKNKSEYFLSEKAILNLRKFLVEDYNCINKLYEMGKLSESKYLTISK